MIPIENQNENLRKLIGGFLTDNYNTVQKEFMFLGPREKIKVYHELLQFSLPMLRAVNGGIDFSQMTEAQLDTIIDELRKSIMKEEE